MRLATFLIAALNAIAFTYIALFGQPMPDAAGTGWVTLFGILFAVLHIPALILALSRKAVGLALLLVLILPALIAYSYLVDFFGA